MPEVNIIRDNAATEVPGVRVLELINQLAAAEGESKAYVLPLMCGTGKSSAISLKIRESIENNEGLLVVTDRKDRLKEYMEPDRNQELAAYLKTHSERVAIMKAENASEIRESHHKYPVLLMTTQRYFRLTVEEIKSFLTWDGGKRGLILIDEKPELFASYTLRRTQLRMLYDAVDTVAPPSIEKSDFLSLVSKSAQEFFSPYRHAIKDRGLVDYTLLTYHEEDIPVPKMEPKTYKDIYDEDKVFFEGIREQLSHSAKYKEIPSIFDSYNFLRRHKHLAVWRDMDSEVFITKSISNADKITEVGATVVVLDGTADYSADYYQQDFMERVGSDQPERKLPGLRVRMINAKGTSRQNLIQKMDITKYAEFMKSDSGETEKYGIFTFKAIKESFETDEDGNLKEDQLPSYLGSNRGRNDLQDYLVLGQVGMLIPPPHRYYEIMLLRSPELREQLDEAGYFNAEFFDCLQKTQEYRELMYRDILADIEQNLFRLPVRSPRYTGEAAYYVFLNFDNHRRLRELIEERFGKKYYGADVFYVENPDILLNLLELLTKHTNIGRVLRYLDRQPIGTEFTAKEIREDKSVKITPTQFDSVKKNSLIKALLASYCINEYTGKQRKMTRFKKTFDIREIGKFKPSGENA